MTTQTLAVGDKALAYVQSGVGPALVIVHGVGGHKEDWAGVAAALAATHTVYAVDMLGFGESSKTGDDLGMAVQAAAILALLDAERVDQAVLVGNSVGGWVTATFAATYPERVAKLVLIDAAGFKAMFEGTPPVNFDPDSPEEMQKLIDITINGPVAQTPGLAERAFAGYVASGEKAITAT
jgi:triacylglycerol lipase